MALAIHDIRRHVAGHEVGLDVQVDLDNSYVTGGYALDLQKDAGLARAANMVLISPQGGYLFEYDYPNKKLKVLTPVKAQAAHTHTENTAASYTQNATTGASGAITASPAAEAANGTDLSAIKNLRLKAWG